MMSSTSSPIIRSDTSGWSDLWTNDSCAGTGWFGKCYCSPCWLWTWVRSVVAVAIATTTLSSLINRALLVCPQQTSVLHLPSHLILQQRQRQRRHKKRPRRPWPRRTFPDRNNKPPVMMALPRDLAHRRRRPAPPPTFPTSTIPNIRPNQQ